MFGCTWECILVVCLANLASNVIICDVIRLDVVCLQKESSISSESTALGALWKPRDYDLEIGEQSHSVRAKAPNPNDQALRHIAKVKWIATSNWLSRSTTLQANITSQFTVRNQTTAATDVTVAYRRNSRTRKR